jgi:taurine--2-oxoglutarate transaminase
MTAKSPDVNDDWIQERSLRHTIFEWSAGQSGANPRVVTHAAGVYFFDSSGKRYLDFSSQYMNVNIGHAHPAVVNAVLRQMRNLPYIMGSMTTEVRAELGAKLAEISPGDLNKAFFTLGGADAIESAIKIARLVTGRQKVVSRFRSYHGSTYGALSVSGDPRRLPHEGAFKDSVVRVEDPYCYRCPWSQHLSTCARECLSHIERILDFEGPQTIAAVLMEGASGGSGCFIYPPDYWPRLRQLCSRHGIVLIDDEVLSGFGRTGEWFAVDHVGVVPDIIAIAKGLTSGYLPLGAVLVSDAIASHFDSNPFPLGLTAQSHPASCAAALANIRVIEDEGLLSNAQMMGRYLQTRCVELASIHQSIGDVRIVGLLGVLELVRSRKTQEPLTSAHDPSGAAVMGDILDRIVEQGVFTLTRPNLIFMAPPLTITTAQVDEGLDAISNALQIADRLVDSDSEVG